MPYRAQNSRTPKASLTVSTIGPSSSARLATVSSVRWVTNTCLFQVDKRHDTPKIKKRFSGSIHFWPLPELICLKHLWIREPNATQIRTSRRDGDQERGGAWRPMRIQAWP